MLVKTDGTLEDLVDLLAESPPPESEGPTNRIRDPNEEDGVPGPEVEGLERGDLVRTPRGFLARVNWAKDGMVGVTYVDPSGASWQGGMTLKVSEVKVVRRGTKSFFGQIFKEKTTEELREMVGIERESRTTVDVIRRPAQKPRDDIRELVKGLTDDDIRELLKVAEKGGERE